MALYKCPDCGCNVSNRSDSCMNCGCPIDVVISRGVLLSDSTELKPSSNINEVNYKTIESESNHENHTISRAKISLNFPKKWNFFNIISYLSIAILILCIIFNSVPIIGWTLFCLGLGFTLISWCSPDNRRLAVLGTVLGIYLSIY